MAIGTAHEINFDGLVGPTHNYAGLSLGNLASFNNLNSVSNPKQAALQGLSKMRALAARGFLQAVVPPQQRPNLDLLRAAGFAGTDADLIGNAYRQAPSLLASAYSASSMWVANAATVSPAADTFDGRTHFTVANLNSKLHRSQESGQTARLLRRLFVDPQYFVVHDALPSTPAFGDEGAANHTRFCAEHGAAGVEMFVYGRVEFNADMPAPQRFIARQTLEASQSVARLHGLDPMRTVFAQQEPIAVDQGVFHNDVIAVSNANVLFYHAQAFLNEQSVLAELRQAMERIEAPLIPIRVAADEVTLADAVSSYLFNSQLLSKNDGRMLLVVPQECFENKAVKGFLDKLLASGSPIDELISFDLRQSMRNGGGPACLRLRVVLSDGAAAAMHQSVRMTESLYTRLVAWVQQHYRDRLTTADLADPQLHREVSSALEALAVILELPDLYRY